MNIFPMRADQPRPTDLNEQLIALARYGKPRLGMYSQGWCATVEMNTNTTGTSFEVKSEFGHKTPATAVAECIERVHTALKALGAAR